MVCLLLDMTHFACSGRWSITTQLSVPRVLGWVHFPTHLSKSFVLHLATNEAEHSLPETGRFAVGTFLDRISGPGFDSQVKPWSKNKLTQWLF